MFRYAILVFLLISLVVVRAKDDAPDEEPHQDAYDAIAGPGGMYESNFTQEHNGCAACTTYASALRRVAWDKFPYSDTATAEDKEQRRKELVNDDRLEDVTMDALLAVLRHYAYAPKYRRYAPLEALIRAKALTDKQLELAQRQALHGGDQGLITFLHGDVMIEEGEAIEKYAGRDVTKGVVLDDYERLPGSGTCDPEMSHECAERVASFRIAKDHKRDVSERTAVASLICQRFCSTNDLRSLLPMEAEDLGVESLAAIHRLEEIAKKAEEQREEEELELLRVRIAEEAERERQAQLALEAELIEGGTAPPATHDEDPPVVDEAPTADEEPLLHIPVDDQEHADAKEGTVTDADPSEM